MEENKLHSVDEMLARRDLDSAVSFRLENCRNIDEYVVLRVLLACQQEMNNGWSAPLVDFCTDQMMLYQVFMKVKLALRRIEFDVSKEGIRGAIAFFEGNHISPYLIYDIIHVNFADEAYMQKKFAESFFSLIEDEEYREEFSQHAGKVVFYDVQMP